MRRKVLNVFVLLSLFFLAGCSTLFKPERVPSLDMGAVEKFSKALSVEIINNQPDTTPQFYSKIWGHRYYVNYNEWTTFFIDKLSGEFRKRDVSITGDSPNKLKVRLSDFSYVMGWTKGKIGMKVSLEMTEKNWKKEWATLEVSSWIMEKSFATIISHTITQILKDPEIIGLLGANN